MGAKIIIPLLMVLAIAGCSSNPGPDFSDPQMPKNFTSSTYIINGKQSEPKKLEQVTINHTMDYDLFKRWKKRQAEKNNQARYEMIKDSMVNEELIEHEQEIEQYCNSLHSNSCLEMTKLTDDSSCRHVEVTCEKNDTDDICIRYDVDISEEAREKGDC